MAAFSRTRYFGGLFGGLTKVRPRSIGSSNPMESPPPTSGGAFISLLRVRTMNTFKLNQTPTDKPQHLPLSLRISIELDQSPTINPDYEHLEKIHHWCKEFLIDQNYDAITYLYAYTKLALEHIESR